MQEQEREYIVGCVLMAAGRAERFGQNKLLTQMGGMPLAGHVLGRMAELGRMYRNGEMPGVRPELRTVTCWDEVDELSRSFGIPCIRYGGGLQSDSVRAALSAPEADLWDGCLFLVGDQPYLTTESIGKLLAGFASFPEWIHRLAWHDRSGSPILFPASCFGSLRAMTGDTGGRSLLKDGSVPVILHQAGSERELADIDTKEDLVRIRTSSGFTGGV